MSVNTQYVLDLRERLMKEFTGWHTKVKEIEALRYLEDNPNLPNQERPTGIVIRTGMTSELIENVKAGLVSNSPTLRLTPLREDQRAPANSSKREMFWNHWLKNNKVIREFVDAQVCAGLGILKAVYYPWPSEDRKQKDGETEDEYLDRQKALKKQWGLPFKTITVHPLSFMFQVGVGDEITELLEYSYKSKALVYQSYGIRGEIEQKINQKVTQSVSGHPATRIQALPAGTYSADLVKVTEYCDLVNYCHVILVEDVEVLSEYDDDVQVNYFMASGRQTSSKDPDKYAMSVAEIMRHIEPHINRNLTRMSEASELLVRKRLAVELPDGTVEELGDDNNPVTRTFEFMADKATALPPGASIKDPFTGAENVYSAMPMIQLLQSLAGQHGVAPIFKGVPPGATGSGYRDNSLYMMAWTQFQYIKENYQNALADMIRWMEASIPKFVQQEVYCGEYSLKPSDISEWPCKYEIEVEPFLPVNTVQDGQFWDTMHTRGYVTKRTVLENGIHIGQPEDELKGVMLEEIQGLLKPLLYQDVLRSLGLLPPNPAQQQGSGLLGPNGQPIQSGDTNVNIMGAQQGGNAQGDNQYVRGAAAEAGQAKQPPKEPGTIA